MDFIKKNKFVILAIALFLIVVFVLVAIKNIFFPNEAKAIYGDRLEGRQNVTISDSKKKSIENNVTSDGIAKSAKVRISGRIIDVVVVANGEASVDSAKTLTTKITDKLTEKEQKYYDIQVFISKEDESENFPIIGYKHHKKKNFSWTKDR